MIEIRSEIDSDYRGIRRVHEQAFGNARAARLVDLLRSHGKATISTVYVGPPVVLDTGVNARLEEQFELEKEAIRDAHPGATELWSEPGTVVNEIGSLSALSAGFQYTEVFAFLPQSVESRLYLFDSAGWIVKYGVTHSMGQAAAGRSIVQDFLRSAPWGRTVPAP